MCTRGNCYPVTADPGQASTGTLLEIVWYTPRKSDSTAPPVVKAGAPASAMSESLTVSSIALTDVVCNPAPCSATTNKYNGNLTVSFNPAKLIIGLAPLKFPIIFSTPGNAGSQTISGCFGGNNVGMGGTTQNPTCNGTPLPPPQAPYVPPTQLQIAQANMSGVPLPKPPKYTSQIINGVPSCVFPGSNVAATQPMTVTVPCTGGTNACMGGNGTQTLNVSGSTGSPAYTTPSVTGSWLCTLGGWTCM
jgi:hypothetical protein